MARKTQKAEEHLMFIVGPRFFDSANTQIVLFAERNPSYSRMELRCAETDADYAVRIKWTYRGHVRWITEIHDDNPPRRNQRNAADPVQR